MSAYLGLRSRAFSLVAVFAALLLSLSFASTATAAGGNDKGASDETLTSGLEAFAERGKDKGDNANENRGGKKDRDENPGNDGADGGTSEPNETGNDRPTICHSTGSGWIRIPPSSPSWGLQGHANHGDDRYVGPDQPCGTDGGGGGDDGECDNGQIKNDADVCVDPDPVTGCTDGKIKNDAGVCVDPDPVTGCTDGKIKNDAGVCVDPDPVTGCTDGKIKNDSGVCVDPKTGCETGEVLNDAGECVKPSTGGDGGSGPGGGDGGNKPGDGGSKPGDGGDKPGDNDGKPGAGGGKPGDGNGGKPGNGGNEPIIKPGEGNAPGVKTPDVKGVEKPSTGNPGTGNPVLQPQTGSNPNAGVPHAVDAGLAPAGKKNGPAKVLPNTGLEDHLGLLTAGGLTLLLMGGVLVAPRRRPVRAAR